MMYNQSMADSGTAGFGALASGGDSATLPLRAKEFAPLPIFAGLSPDVLDELLAQASTRPYRPAS